MGGILLNFFVISHSIVPVEYGSFEELLYMYKMS